MDPDRLPLISIAVGTTLAAERRDRPLAYRLRERMLSSLDRRAQPAEVVVTTDTLYLRDASIQRAPAIAIGPPEDNALTALAEAKIPLALSIEHTLTVRLDQDFRERLAACWGVNDAATASACDALVERYLEAMLDGWLGPADA